MAYNPLSNPLDFNDEMMLGNVSSLSNPSDLQMNSFYNSDTLDMEDTKDSLLDALVTNNANTKL